MLTFRFKRAIIFQSLAFVYIKGQEDGWEASCYVPKTRLYLHFRGRGEVLASYVPFANVCDKLLEVWQMHRARGLIWDNLNIRECFLISLYAWPRWIPPTWIDLHLPKLGSDLDLPKLPKFQSESGTSRGQNYLESGEYWIYLEYMFLN